MESAGVHASGPVDRWTVWEVPGKPVSVRLSPDVVARLGMAVQQGIRALPQRGLETGGLLIGSRSETESRVVVQVYDLEPVKSEHASGPSYVLSERDRLLLAERIAVHEATCKNSSIVGIYRSHTRPDLAITEEDASLFSTYFKNASDVFLLIKPSSEGSPMGGFIIREGGEVVSKSPYVQFPLRGIVAPQAIREIPRPALREAQASPPTAPVVQAPAVRSVQLPAPPQNTARARSLIWVAAAIAIGVAAGLYWRIPSRAPVSSPAKVAALPALHVSFIGNSLRLSWDAQISRHANRGVLWIKDGPETVRLELDSKQLSEGSVVYWPKHSDVDLRLEAISPDGILTESVRSIGGPSQAVAASPAPAVALESRAVPPFTKAEGGKRIADPESAPEPPSRNGIGMASRQVSAEFREARSPAPVAAIALPDSPIVQPVVVPPVTSGREFLALIAPASTPNSVGVPVRVSVEPVPASHRSFAAILKRSTRSDYVPPAVLREPGLLNPAHRSIARKVSVDVKVYVNASGTVEYSEVLSKAAEADRDLAALAMFSARRWEFVPARTRDGSVPSEVILHYQFGPS